MAEPDLEEEILQMKGGLPAMEKEAYKAKRRLHFINESRVKLHEYIDEQMEHNSSILGFITETSRFFQSYLVSYFFCFNVRFYFRIDYLQFSLFVYITVPHSNFIFVPLR